MTVTGDRTAFVAAYGGIFEHSPWIAEAAWDRGLPPDAGTAAGLHRAMCAAMRAMGEERKLALLRAHPDLAGRLARAGRLTAASQGEQAAAGLDHLTDEERARFADLNQAYRTKFGFPFIIAARGRDKAEILAAFERRVGAEAAQEFATALSEVERIALLRLADLLP